MARSCPGGSILKPVKKLGFNPKANRVNEMSERETDEAEQLRMENAELRTQLQRQNDRKKMG